MSDDIYILLLASGSSHRMEGYDKLLCDLNGISMLERCLQAACASNAEDVFVTVPKGNIERKQIVENTTANLIEIEHSHRGMGHAIARAFEQMPQGVACVVALADMPDISSDIYDALFAAYDTASDIVRPVNNVGQLGHPVLFGSSYFSALAKLSGDVGAREIIAKNNNSVKTIFSHDDGILQDIDTQDDLEKWRIKNTI